MKDRKGFSKQRIIVRDLEEVEVMDKAMRILFKGYEKKPPTMREEMTAVSLYKKIDYHLKTERR